MKRLFTTLLVLLPLVCGAKDIIVFDSENLHTTDTVLVFSPSAEKSLPTLFLLHGYSGNYSDWSKNMDLQEVADRTGWRIITPDGFYSSWYFDQAGEGTMQWRKFFWKELYPAIADSYGLDPDKTFIDGLSMGGHGAMNIFLDRPDLFRGAGSMSGVLDLRSSGGALDMIPGLLGVKDINDPVCTAQSAVNRVGRIKEVCGKEKAGKKLLVISCGVLDTRFVPTAYAMAEKCDEEGIRNVLIISPARHRWPYWIWILNYHISLFSDELDLSPGLYPGK